MINIDELIRSFESKSTNRREIYNDFLYHCFQAFEKLIKNKKHNRKKDKYAVSYTHLTLPTSVGV